MRIRSLLTRIKLVGFLPISLLCFLGLVTGCSGEQQVEEVLQAEEGGVEEAESSGQQAAGEYEYADQEAGYQEEIVETEPEPAEESVLSLNPEPGLVDDADSTELGSAVPTVKAPNAKRVVRYVVRDGAEIFSQPEEGSPIGKLRKGDRILVIEEGDWGRISDSMFIPLDDLSSKAVARERRKARWEKPAH